MDAKLLEPICEDRPCGEDLSFSSEFDTIRELRREDDPTLEQGAWVTPLKVADWKAAEAMCADLLRTRTKDLRLAAWWCDAAARNRGFAGLAEGLELCTRLCERYWAGLHPLAEDGDVEQRIGNLGWLLQRLRVLVQLLPVTRSPDGSLTLADLAAARALQAQIDRNPEDAERLAENRVTLERFMKSLRDTAPAHLQQTLDAARRCEAALQDLQRTLDGLLGDEGPGFSAARDALAAAVHEIERLARETGMLAAGPASEGPTSPAPDGPPASVAVAAAAAHPVDEGPIRTRTQALARLREVAEFFRRTEPHSPVAYLAAKAASWGEMPLHVWLRSVLKDPGALAHLEELLGVEAAGPESAG
ncbi:type VI secretion system protein TssA [Caldimonas thermodepolymerans]|jgi:type VI secretion-associated protein, ImpA family|uniref:Type VI secretion system protein TssA n=1 Tax=Caldimonas thermodepolymerans TaxID=215580 RepID=A0A2S5T5X1_9BURK|nr:type VI secretion system protein TssA [Caldimonas thermodepolymerans]PPE70404.1 type VI secretion system protein TssA [Caldimonas thermodepolymerans]QPC30312.1 type VI secretion system protein TssA [Caldimonas thermodepolymerans]RDI00709.1 type VI secretion system protein ImpA [Caldimonas thermodepolymerans]UZG43074.1 type VI secretion system protein TssA [Caldimonas thermodepolymerans]